MTPDWLTWVTLAAFALWLLAVIRLRAQWQWHHAYFGVVAISPEVPMWLRLLAFVVLLDDTIQHLAQLSRPEFRSPLHRLAARLGII